MNQVPYQVKLWCYAYLYRTDRYVACVSVDQYGGICVSHTGWHTHAPEPASEEWIGANVRKSLLTSKQFRAEELDRSVVVQQRYRERSAQVFQALVDDLMRTYRYRSARSVTAKALSISAAYLRDASGPIELLATNRKRGGVWDALANTSRSSAVVKQIPFEVSDETLGSAVREMLAISTISGERVEMS